MRAATPAGEWPWRQGPGALWQAFRRRLKDARFWAVQIMVAAITALHYAVEAFPVDESISIVHHVPVILYLIPVVYASLYYGWEGGVLTAIWSGILTIPSILTSHLSDFHWVGETGQVGVTLAVGAVLAWRVKLEAEQRQRAESTSAELAVSEQKYRGIFENAEDPILLCDRDGVILAANPALSALSGYSARMAGMSVAALFGENGARKLTGNDQAGRLRLSVRRRDGSTAIVDVAKTVLGGQGDATVQAILRDVTEEEQQHQHMRAYVREVTRAQEEERTRIARELHDDTAQALVLLCRSLDAARGNGDDGKIQEIRALADSILEGVRRFSRDLRPSILDDLGLLPAIEWMSAETARRGTVRASVIVDGTPRRLSSEAELVLFRIAQEALRNAEKHAGPCSATVTIAFSDHAVQLSVEDDGAGFSLKNGSGAGKLGLVGMRERAELIGADFSIGSRPGEGTSVRVVLEDAASNSRG